LGSRSIKI